MPRLSKIGAAALAAFGWTGLQTVTADYLVVAGGGGGGYDVGGGGGAGATAYYNSAVTIDGNSVTPKWQGGTAPTSGNVSSIDSYTYVIFKTGSATFTVLASVTKFA